MPRSQEPIALYGLFVAKLQSTNADEVAEAVNAFGEFVSVALAELMPVPEGVLGYANVRLPIPKHLLPTAHAAKVRDVRELLLRGIVDALGVRCGAVPGQDELPGALGLYARVQDLEDEVDALQAAVVELREAQKAPPHAP